MAQQRKQHLNRRERKAFVRILLAAALLCLLLLALAPGCSLRSCLLAKKKAEALSQENARLLREGVQLNKEIRLLEQNEKYLEKIAREQYGMLMNDEEVYCFEPPEEKKE